MMRNCGNSLTYRVDVAGFPSIENDPVGVCIYLKGGHELACRDSVSSDVAEEEEDDDDDDGGIFMDDFVDRRQLRRGSGDEDRKQRRTIRLLSMELPVVADIDFPPDGILYLCTCKSDRHR